MSRYQTLATQVDNAQIPTFAASSIIANDEGVYRITPVSPVPEKVPSFLTPQQLSTRPGPGAGNNTGTGTSAFSRNPYPVYNSTTYGPTSRGNASLRYYGDGPY